MFARRLHFVIIKKMFDVGNLYYKKLHSKQIKNRKYIQNINVHKLQLYIDSGPLSLLRPLATSTANCLSASIDDPDDDSDSDARIAPCSESEESYPKDMS